MKSKAKVVVVGGGVVGVSALYHLAKKIVCVDTRVLLGFGIVFRFLPVAARNLPPRSSRAI